jgi:hypothetical protein
MIKLASLLLSGALVTGAAGVPYPGTGRMGCLEVPKTSYFKAYVTLSTDGTLPRGTRSAVCRIWEKYPTVSDKYEAKAPNGEYEVFRIVPVRFGKS